LYFPSEPQRISTHDMPLLNGEVNPHELRKLIVDTYKPTSAIIEQVGPMKRDGVRQAWRFSAAYTTARTVVALLDIPMTLVVPGRWKKAMNVKGGDDGKEQCRALAVQKFPACAAQFARKLDHGRAESALLALYFARLNPRKEAEKLSGTEIENHQR
jgi:crossover junction endodeoxyribonuclease RuvC